MVRREPSRERSRFENNLTSIVGGYVDRSRLQGPQCRQKRRCRRLPPQVHHPLALLICSESSLFVFPHKLILKTCGTTTLLAGISPILELAHKAGFTYGDVYRVFYSRKSFMFPNRQRSPHGSWGEEVQRLNTYFGTVRFTFHNSW